MSQNVVLKVENLSKKFYRTDGSEFYVFKNLNFELKEGDSLGVIGPNGCGKSTLLKIIAGIIKPTSGTVTYEGKIGSLLEIGSGFHPELNGHENIKLIASFYNNFKSITPELINSIQNFSELGEALNEPIKTYSNGMFLRLALAVYLHIDANIILIDEVFSTGDYYFQQKCLHALENVQNKHKTMLMASHNNDEIRTYTKNTLFLKKDKSIILNTDQAINHYILESNKKFDQLAKSEENDVEDLIRDIQMVINTTRTIEINENSLPLTQAGESIIFDLNFISNITADIEIIMMITTVDAKAILADSHRIREKPLVIPVEKNKESKLSIEYNPNNLGEGIFKVSLGFSTNFAKESRGNVHHNVVSFYNEFEEWQKDASWNKFIKANIRPRLKWLIE